MKILQKSRLSPILSLNSLASMVTTTVSSAMVSVGTTRIVLASVSRISPHLRLIIARCIYNERKYFYFLSLGEGNTAEDGSAVDEFGQINGVMCKCPVKGCWLQKKTGERGKVCYKVYAIHMASHHRIVEQILEADSRPVMQEIMMGLKTRSSSFQHFKENLVRDF